MWFKAWTVGLHPDNGTWLYNKFKPKKRKLSLISNPHVCVPLLPWLMITWLWWAQQYSHSNTVRMHFWIICHPITVAIPALVQFIYKKTCIHRCYQSNLEVRLLAQRFRVIIKVGSSPPESGGFDGLLTRNAWNETSLENRMSPLESVFLYLNVSSLRCVNPVCPGFPFGPRHLAGTPKGFQLSACHSYHINTYKPGRQCTHVYFNHLAPAMFSQPTVHPRLVFCFFFSEEKDMTLRNATGLNLSWIFKYQFGVPGAPTLTLLNSYVIYFYRGHAFWSISL